MLGGIEAGGTKFVLAAGRSPADIAARHVIPTGDPANTLREAADWFRAQGALASLGIANFGPVDLDPGSLTLGHITSTPKPGWRNCDIAGFFAKTLSCPVGFDTDVNAAALAEWRARGASRQASLAYVTVGTGIGGGVVAGGEIFGRPTHPEVGHIRVARHEDDGEFANAPIMAIAWRGLSAALPLWRAGADGSMRCRTKARGRWWRITLVSYAWRSSRSRQWSEW